MSAAVAILGALLVIGSALWFLTEDDHVRKGFPLLTTAIGITLLVLGLVGT